MATIEDARNVLIQQFQSALAEALPRTSGLSLDIRFVDNGRQKWPDESCESWDPLAGEIRIGFGPPPASEQPVREDVTVHETEVTDLPVSKNAVTGHTPSYEAAAREFDQGGSFEPVEIRGEPLSETIIRERRAGW